MYYIGTKEQCEAYNTQVSTGEGYSGNVTTNWAKPRKHPDKELWAITMHPKYACEMELAVSLGDDWTEEIEEI